MLAPNSTPNSFDFLANALPKSFFAASCVSYGFESSGIFLFRYFKASPARASAVLGFISIFLTNPLCEGRSFSDVIRPSGSTNLYGLLLAYSLWPVATFRCRCPQPLMPCGLAQPPTLEAPPAISPKPLTGLRLWTRHRQDEERHLEPCARLQPTTAIGFGHTRVGRKEEGAAAQREPASGLEPATSGAAVGRWRRSRTVDRTQTVAPLI